MKRRSIQTVEGHTYTITRDELTEDGRDFNGKFIDPRTYGLPRCSTCDSLIPTCGYDRECDVHHLDVMNERLTVCVGDPLLNRKEAA